MFFPVQNNFDVYPRIQYFNCSSVNRIPLFQLVMSRARRMALIIASAPELTKFTAPFYPISWAAILR